MAGWYYWFEDWLAYDKVVFDGVNKLVIINVDEHEIDIQTDIYTAWVQWRSLRDNSKYLDAIRFTGGDPTTQGQFSGLIFFMINGWRIFFDHSVVFSGSIFSDNYSSPFLVPDNTFIGQSVVSSLVSMVSTGGGTGDAPTAQENAEATKILLLPEFDKIPTAVENAAVVKSSLSSDFNAIPTAQENALAVKSELSTDLNNIGTPEENAAAVWGSALTGFTDGSAGYLINLIQASQTIIEQLSRELHRIQGLDSANPMIVTPNSRNAGDVHLNITGDGKTSTTVTRVP